MFHSVSFFTVGQTSVHPAFRPFGPNTKYRQQVEVPFLEGNLLRNHPLVHGERSSMKIIVTWSSNGPWFITAVILTQRDGPMFANPTVALNLPEVKPPFSLSDVKSC